MNKEIKGNVIQDKLQKYRLIVKELEDRSSIKTATIRVIINTVNPMLTTLKVNALYYVLCICYIFVIYLSYIYLLYIYHKFALCIFLIHAYITCFTRYTRMCRTMVQKLMSTMKDYEENVC